MTVAISTGGDGSSWSGTIDFQASNDGVTWFSAPCNLLSGTVGAIGGVAASTTSNGLWQCPVSGIAYFQAQGVAISGGVANVTLNLTTDANPITYTLTDASTGAVIRTGY